MDYKNKINTLNQDSMISPNSNIIENSIEDITDEFISQSYEDIYELVFLDGNKYKPDMYGCINCGNVKGHDGNFRCSTCGEILNDFD